MAGKTTGCGRMAASSSRAAAAESGPRAPRAAGSRKALAASTGSSAVSGRAHQRASRSMSQPLTVWPRSRSAVAMDRPETSETSCSAEGPPRRTAMTVGVKGARTLGGCAWSRVMRPPLPASRRRTRPRSASSMPRSRRTVSRTCSARRADVRGRGGADVDDEVGVLRADHGAADLAALEAQLVDDAPRRVALGVAEDAARGALADGLVRLPPATDVVEPRGDGPGVGGLQREGGRHHHLRAARPARA